METSDAGDEGNSRTSDNQWVLLIDIWKWTWESFLQLVPSAVSFTMALVTSTYHRHESTISAESLVKTSRPAKVGMFQIRSFTMTKQWESNACEIDYSHIDTLKYPLIFLIAARYCRLLRAQLWDIETIDEFSFVLDRIYAQTRPLESPRIAVNFIRGKHCKFSSASNQC